VPPSRGRDVNVLQHIGGYFKDYLDRDGKAGIASAIDEYRSGARALHTVTDLIRHYVVLHGVTYLAGQVYLDGGGGTRSAIIQAHHDRAPIPSP
jgi:uncharacterized protein YbgA (DUF1722 family)